ncbi:MAG: ABC transporter permease subunit [Actinomycetota bacterium]|jgi:molybdate/tungstate transport system permease protein|nr:ABC transporter permease subunit [Actinomycetota bacterium]
MKRSAIFFSAFVLALLFVPVLILLLHARSVPELLKSASSIRAIEVTLTSGVVALAIDICLGMPLAWVLARVLRPRWGRIWATLLVIPLLMPPLVLGLVLAYVVGPASPFGSLVSLLNTFPGLVIAQVYESLPFFVLTAWGYLSAIPTTLEEDVWVLGKNPWRAFWFVTWPIARAGFAVAGAMAWARIVGAFGAPIIVAYHPSALPVAIWIKLEELGLPSALGLAVWLVIVTLPLPVWLNWRFSRVRIER